MRIPALLLMIIAFGVSACGSSSPTAPASASCPVLAGHGSMCARLDGAMWTASSTAPTANPLYCSRFSSVPGLGDGIVCQGSDDQGRRLSFIVSARLGTQHFGSEDSFCCDQGQFVETFPYGPVAYGSERPGGSGTITITSLTATTVS